MLNSTDRKKGFTLIEVLTALAIVSVLTTVFFTYLKEAKQKAVNNSVVQSAVSLRTALELYAADHGGMYPGEPNNIFYTGNTLDNDGTTYKPYGPIGVGDINVLLSEYIKTPVLKSPVKGQLYAYYYNSISLKCLGSRPRYMLILGNTADFDASLPFTQLDNGTEFPGYYCIPGPYR